MKTIEGLCLTFKNDRVHDPMKKLAEAYLLSSQLQDRHFTSNYSRLVEVGVCIRAPIVESPIVSVDRRACLRSSARWHAAVAMVVVQSGKRWPTTTTMIKPPTSLKLGWFQSSHRDGMFGDLVPLEFVRAVCRHTMLAASRRLQLPFEAVRRPLRRPFHAFAHPKKYRTRGARVGRAGRL